MPICRKNSPDFAPKKCFKKQKACLKDGVTHFYGCYVTSIAELAACLEQVGFRLQKIFVNQQ